MNFRRSLPEFRCQSCLSPPPITGSPRVKDIVLASYHGLMIADLLSRRLVLLLPLLLWTGAPLHAGDADEPGPALNGVAHVAFRVSDVPKSREFYRTLGWEQAFEFSD